MLPDLNSLSFFPPLELSLFRQAVGGGRPGQLLSGCSEGQLGEHTLTIVEILFRPNNAHGGVLARVLGARREWGGVYLEDRWRVGAAHVLARQEVLV